MWKDYFQKEFRTYFNILNLPHADVLFWLTFKPMFAEYDTAHRPNIKLEDFNVGMVNRYKLAYPAQHGSQPWLFLFLYLSDAWTHERLILHGNITRKKYIIQFR